MEAQAKNPKHRQTEKQYAHQHHIERSIATKMLKYKILLFLIILVLNIFGLLFYFSTISLCGYWSDNILLLVISCITFYYSKLIINILITKFLQILSIICLIFICLTSFSFFHGIVPVHYIPAGSFEDKTVHAYFIERGNLGSTNGCYGEIQYNRQIKWLPFLEIKIETDNCSYLTYKNIIYGT